MSRAKHAAATKRDDAPARQQKSAGEQRETESVVIPVIEEGLRVSKRAVETGGVRINKIVNEREEIIDEPLLRDTVEVERVPVGRLVDGPVSARQEGETMIIPLLEEVLIVEKRLMLKEELRVTKRRVETREPQRVTLRGEEVAIERIAPPEGRAGEDKNPRARAARTAKGKGRS